MIYISYEEYKNKYYEAQKKYDEVLCEKESLFAITQPKATTYDKELVSGGNPSNTFDEYLIKKEAKQIDERLEEARSILKDRERLLKLKEEELKSSSHPYDKTYYNRCIKNKTPNQIAILIPCDRATVYRYMQEIERNLRKLGYELHSLYARKQGKWQEIHRNNKTNLKEKIQ